MSSDGMLKHFFRVLIQENLRGFLLVAATTAGLAIQGLRADTFQLLSVIPIFFASTYLAWHVQSVLKLAKQTYHAVPVPYFLCLGQTSDWFEVALRQQEQKLKRLRLAWHDIQKTYRIHKNDWTFFDEHRLGLSPEEWKNKVGEISRHFDYLTNRVSTQPVYHVFLAVPGTLSLALGAKIGRRTPIVVYQHAGMVKDPYIEVFSTEGIDSREGYHLLNQRITNYERIEVETELRDCKERGRTLIVLDFTGHELRKPYPECDAHQTIRLRLRDSHGHIPLDGDWISIAHEIASLIHQQLDNDQEVHLLLGIPASLAFIIGTVLGTTHDVWLYHYNRHDAAYTQPFALHLL